MKMKRFLSVLVASFTLTVALAGSKSQSKEQNALTNTEGTLSHIPCESAFFKTLEGWEVPAKWSETPGSDMSERVMHATTKSPGVSLDVKVKNKRTIAYRNAPDSVIEVSWSEPACVASIAYVPHHVPQNAFTDADLKKLLAQSARHHSSGIIYFWSPHMNYSVTGVKEMKKIAHDMHLEVTFLLDPKAALNLNKQVQREQNFPNAYMRTVESRELLDRHIMLHFPSMVLYSNGKLMSHWLPGYKQPAQARNILKGEFYAAK